jgi:hypothetical protein
VSILEFVLNLSRSALQHPEKYLVPGVNGPYNDLERPIRNLGHWLIIFSFCYRWTGESCWRHQVNRIGNLILDDIINRPKGNFYHRDKMGKDRCNGLIGPAWTIEALTSCYSVLKEEVFLQCASDVFLRHPWNEAEGLWNCLDIDGSTLPIDLTFNHQLWFAYSGARVIEHKQEAEIANRVKEFLNNIESNLLVLENGLIWHLLKYANKKVPSNEILSFIQLIKRKIRYYYYLPRRYRNLKLKSIGYQSFNLLAFGPLRKVFPDHEFWQSEIFFKSVNFIVSKYYKKKIIDNIYSFSYNGPGFEIPSILCSFSDVYNDIGNIDNEVKYWLDLQFSRTFDESEFMFSKNNPDPPTLTSRIYELLQFSDERILNYEISLNESA